MVDAAVDVHPARAGGLRPADQPVVGEHLAHHEGHLAHLRPGHARDRVEVDAQLVRVAQVLRAYRVRMQVDAAEVDEPGQPAASRTTISCAVRPDG